MTGGVTRRALAGGAVATAIIAGAARSQTLTPAVQRIDPRPAPPGSLEVLTTAAVAPYRPRQQVSGAIRLWGHGNRKLPWMHHLVDLWGEGFSHFHPEARLEYHLYGTSSGIPSLFNGLGDVALLGEEILPAAARAFERFKGYTPTGVPIMTGSLDIRNFDYAQQVFVHRDNPLEQITLSQLDAILGAEHRRGGPLIRRWGEMGLTGGWASREIVPYSWAIDDSFGHYLESAVMLGSHRWNANLREFKHIIYDDGRIYDHGQQILDALSRDVSGIAVSNIRYAGPLVKPLALGASERGPFVQASKASLIDQSYPLTRLLPAVIDRPPDMRVEPKVREFLRYLVSREGQEMVNRDGRYLPLSAAAAANSQRIVG